MAEFEYKVEIMTGSQTEHLHKIMSDHLSELFPNIKKGIANSLALSVIVTSFTPKEDILNLSMDTVLGSIVKENIAQFSIPNDVIKIIEDEQNYKNTYCKKDLYGNDRIIISKVN